MNGKKRLLIAVSAALLAIVALPAVAMAAPPTNDDFDAPVVITEVPYQTVVTFTNEATQAPDDPNCFSGGRTIWFSYTPQEDIRIDASTFGSNYDTTLGIYTGARGSLTELGCNDDALGDKRSIVRFAATAGQTYYLMLGSLAQGTHGTAKLSLTEAPGPPDNDDLRNAEIVENLPYQQRVYVGEATTGEDDANCFGNARTVWYQFRPDKDRKVEASTSGSSYDTTLAVYARTAGELKQLECVDNARRSSAASVTMDLTGGKTYFFRVGAQGAYADELLFSMRKVPIPLKIELNMSPTGQVSSVTGVARITGTIKCNREASIRLFGSMRQKNGSSVTEGSFGSTIHCDGKQKWSAKISGGRRAFGGGMSGVVLRADSSADRVRKSVAKVVRLDTCACNWRV